MSRGDRHVLHDGCLYTQLQNPVSNRIYQAIGYRPVAEVTRYRFE
jgi:predicted GNAT family acetyltransferase